MNTRHDLRAHNPLPPIPDVPYVIGLHDGLLHAVSHDAAVRAVEHSDSDSRRVTVGSECGECVAIARRWGPFQRGTEHLDRHDGRLCPHCAWIVALDQNTTDTELAALTPTGAELAALHLLLPDPMLAVRICQRILATARDEGEYDADNPRWAQHLAHATAHRPILLVDEDCIEGGCEHGDLDGCYRTSNTVACDACSIQAGSWAGEWEGQYECTVPAPCAVLPAMAEHYHLGEAAQ